EQSDYASKLQNAGFINVDIEPWRIYAVDDARAFLTKSGIDVDRLAPQVEAKFASAFVRATKPADKTCCGPDSCAQSTGTDDMRPFVGEFVGTAMLLGAVVGSGIMGDRLAGGNVAIALLANSAATGAALIALILTFGPVSGAHFNPAVSLADASQGGLS